MDKIINVFDFEDQQIRTTIIDGEPWFVAKDLCDILEISNATDVVQRLDEDEKATSIISTQFGDKETNVVNEFGLYSIILTSRKPEAKKFKKWVTSKVLPSIRKTGSYLSQADKEELERLRKFAEVVDKKMRVTVNDDDFEDDSKANIKAAARLLYVFHGKNMNYLLNKFAGKISRKTLYNWKKDEDWDVLREDHEKRSHGILGRLYKLFERAISEAEKDPQPTRLYGVNKIYVTLRGVEEMTLANSDVADDGINLLPPAFSS